MARKPASESAEKWKRNLQGAEQTIRNGIMRVEVAPGQKAAEAADKWKAGVDRAHAENKFGKNSARVTLEEWRAKTLEKGLPRINAGVEQAVSDVQVFHEELAAYQDTYLDKLNSKKVLSLADAEAKMTENMRMMSKFRRTRRG